MSELSDSLPLEAAKALPLVEAYCLHADPKLVAAYRLARDRRGNVIRWQYNGRPQSPTAHVLSAFDTHSLSSWNEKQRILFKIEADFVAKLRRGELTAWARVDSPLGPWREMPPSAWSTVRIDNVRKGTAKGPGVMLFDIRVGPCVVVPAPQPDPMPVTTPRLARTGDPGRPELGATLYTAEFERRRDMGQLEPSLAREAETLLAWFTANHPDQPAPTAKTIANRLRAPYRAACRQ